MGLDMYLYAHKNISSVDWETSATGQFEKKLNPEYSIVTSLMGANDWAIQPENLGFIRIQIQVGYWRKVNAIHSWFVNLSGREDDCSPIYVSRDDLINLKIACLEVLNDKDKAEEVLPTESGFFFGGTEYNEWYFAGIEDTVATITKAIEDVPQGWSFEYQASW